MVADVGLRVAGWEDVSSVVEISCPTFYMRLKNQVGSC